MESRHLGGGLSAYASFWRRYKRPPKREYWDFIVSRLDLLVPQDARPYHGDESVGSRVPRDRVSLQDSKTPSSESNAARAVLDAGRDLWRYYHAQPSANPNASYYDIRLHFQGVKRTASGKEQMNATSADETYDRLLAALRAAHKALAAQIAPKVYEYGFLKV